jgi:acyl-CoA reductase-like NAD-dependent aldehyde dehydrogenase
MVRGAGPSAPSGLAAPLGGTKASGIGREAGHDGICEFLERKYMAVTVGERGETVW